MKAVLRVALGYFTFAPLQRWFAVLGVLLVVLALVMRVATGEPGGAALGLSIAGGILLVLGPVFGGGVLLRTASSRSTILMLLPAARLRLLLGTTLALNIVVLLVTLPFLLDPPTGPRGNPVPAALDVFCIAWGAMALDWALVFVLSGYRFGLTFIWLVPVLGANLPRFLQREHLPDPSSALIAGLVIWGAFAIWYLRQRAHRPFAIWNPGTTSAAEGAGSRLPGRKQPDHSAPQSLPVARRQWLLGGGSLPTYVGVGAGTALLLVIIFVWLMDRPTARNQVMMGNLFFIGILFSCFSFGYWLVGRSRVLWLRGGLDRAGLLRHAEASGLLPVLVSSLTATLVFITAQILLRPDLFPTIVLNALAQLTLAACLAYWGLSFTRSWSIGTTIECVLAFVVGLVGMNALGAAKPSTRLLAGLALFALLALLLRARALRRWRTLDWRVKRPQMNPPMGMRGRA